MKSANWLALTIIKVVFLNLTERITYLFNGGVSGVNNNRHLKIFEHYSQVNALLIENNIPRGLAIVMSENPLLLDRFIDYINTNCSNDIRVQKHNKAEEVDTGIQQSITKIVDAYPSLKLILGMTLKTESMLSGLK